MRNFKMGWFLKIKSTTNAAAAANATTITTANICVLTLCQALISVLHVSAHLPLSTMYEVNTIIDSILRN